MLDVKDLKRVEEELELPEDDGIALEPFNLEKEREEGRFDESGNYVENKAEEDADAEDPWLASEEGERLSLHMLKSDHSDLPLQFNQILHPDVKKGVPEANAIPSHQRCPRQMCVYAWKSEEEADPLMRNLSSKKLPAHRYCFNC